MKKIEIIPLAKKKLDRREIGEEWVIETLRDPGQIVEGHGGRNVAQKNLLLKVKNTY